MVSDEAFDCHEAEYVQSCHCGMVLPMARRTKSTTDMVNFEMELTIDELLFLSAPTNVTPSLCGGGKRETWDKSMCLVGLQ